MISVTRLEEPKILAEKKAEWQAKYEQRRAAKPGARPDSSKYAHEAIVATLTAMSHGKCFYCEDKPRKMTVDHYVEVAERPEGAFTWSNLYLACDGCQGKLPNRSIPVAACVDPCDPNCAPADHLRFDDEYVCSRTTPGDQSIRKYKLNRGELVSERRRFLRLCDGVILRVSKTKGWRSMSPDEREQLLAFAREDAPFSLMFRAYVDRFTAADGA